MELLAIISENRTHVYKNKGEGYAMRQYAETYATSFEIIKEHVKERNLFIIHYNIEFDDSFEIPTYKHLKRLYK